MTKEILNKIVARAHDIKCIGVNHKRFANDIIMYAEQLLQAEDKCNWICVGCSRECKTLSNNVIPNYFCTVVNQKTNWQPIKKEQEKDKK